MANQMDCHRGAHLNCYQMQVGAGAGALGKNSFNFEFKYLKKN